MAITLRSTKGQELTHQELDQNFIEFYFSSSVADHVVSLFTYTTGSFSGLEHTLTINTGSTLLLYSESTSQATISGSLTVTGDITAQEFHTEIQSASIIYTSGSSKFGDTLDDAHNFTGSLIVTGSTTIIGNSTYTGNSTHNGNTIVTGSNTMSGSLSVTGGATFSNSGSTSVTITDGYIILTEVSESLNFADDTAAASGGIPLGGLYRNGNFIQIRVS